jgi:hypothetical protein
VYLVSFCGVMGVWSAKDLLGLMVSGAHKVPLCSCEPWLCIRRDLPLLEGVWASPERKHLAEEAGLSEVALGL